MSKFKKLDKKVKKMDVHDIQLTKLATATAILAFVSGLVWFQNWVISVSWYWFALVAVIFAIRPLKKFWG